MCFVLLDRSSLTVSTCGTFKQPHSAADGTSASQRSWLHWGILEDKSHLLSCTRARSNADKVWQLPACFTTAATRSSSSHLQDFMVSCSCVAGILHNPSAEGKPSQQSEKYGGLITLLNTRRRPKLNLNLLLYCISPDAVLNVIRSSIHYLGVWKEIKILEVLPKLNKIQVSYIQVSRLPTHSNLCFQILKSSLSHHYSVTGQWLQMPRFSFSHSISSPGPGSREEGEVDQLKQAMRQSFYPEIAADQVV